MKKLVLFCAAFIAFAAFTACGEKENQGNDELIVGKWEVENVYIWYHDFTDERTVEEILVLPDTSYRGYDSIEFKADGTTRWHMCDRWVRDGLFPDAYRDFEWRISGDTLYVSINWAQGSVTGYAIKELDNEDLVIESYENNEHSDYGQHHHEQIYRYTLGRVL